jgi:hypothetical protein
MQLQAWVERLDESPSPHAEETRETSHAFLHCLRACISYLGFGFVAT